MARLVEKVWERVGDWIESRMLLVAVFGMLLYDFVDIPVGIFSVVTLIVDGIHLADVRAVFVCRVESGHGRQALSFRM